MENTLAARLEAAQNRRNTLTSPAAGQMLDDSEIDILAANEALGSALVQIGMALGLPKPTPGRIWGATEVLAKARYLLAELEDRRAEQAQHRGHAQRAQEAAARIDTAFSHGVPSGSDDPVTAGDWRIVLDYARNGGEHPDVAAYLAECKANSEAPEHDGDAS